MLSISSASGVLVKCIQHGRLAREDRRNRIRGNETKAFALRTFVQSALGTKPFSLASGTVTERGLRCVFLDRVKVGFDDRLARLRWSLQCSEAPVRVDGKSMAESAGMISIA